MIRLTPHYHPRVWGGRRLSPGPEPVGEAWVVFAGNRIDGGPHAGRTLRDLVHEQPRWLLGRRGEQFTDFPVLIKLLDCQAWLSVQVHPNDEQALNLHGPGHVGKTEAWHVLQAEPGARVISGVQEETTPAELHTHILSEQVMALAQYQEVHAGDTLFIPAGTLHALGPGLLTYEVQQSSDLTYRMYDWDRPQDAGRALHLREAALVTQAEGRGTLHAGPTARETGVYPLVTCAYFTTELLHLDSAVTGRTEGETFHALTVTEGTVEVRSDTTARLHPFDTLLIPASSPPYELIPQGNAARLLRSSLP
ncbi:class I mannose-6-phosphate isomerase (plasmid) [Deinococcus taeanensis]|uniref:type I phosphomannose isomerase catalytic subunit n=1 Tax=Deinococcus taeanensis TaxID=2737050 RepID=UPI001CDBACC3|nr:type I phosphomannose isomerase catalytic subunit [Deinococcus taeanensis]UBV44465.1 class I mannose-6-phosphate isomerase [Deinococcus taeanensis]